MSASLKTPNYNLPLYDGNDFLNTNDFDTAMTIIDSRMKQNETDADSVSGQIEEVTNVANQAMNNVNAMNETVGEHGRQIQSLKDKQKILEENESNLENQVNGINQKADTNSGAISGLNTSLEQITGRVDATENNITSLEGTVEQNKTAVDASVEGLNTRVTNVETEVNAATGDIASNQAEILKIKNAFSGKTFTGDYIANTGTIPINTMFLPESTGAFFGTFKFYRQDRQQVPKGIYFFTFTGQYPAFELINEYQMYSSGTENTRGIAPTSQNEDCILISNLSFSATPQGTPKGVTITAIAVVTEPVDEFTFRYSGIKYSSSYSKLNCNSYLIKLPEVN